MADTPGYPVAGDRADSVATARGLQERMARLSDGAVHRERRDRVLALLPEATQRGSRHAR